VPFGSDSIDPGKLVRLLLADYLRVCVMRLSPQAAGHVSLVYGAINHEQPED